MPPSFWSAGPDRALDCLWAGASGQSTAVWVSERQYEHLGMTFARPTKASLNRPGSGMPQSREPLFAAALRNVTQAVPSKFREARTIVRMYANKCGAFDGYAADSTAANTAYHSHQMSISVMGPLHGRFPWPEGAAASVSSRHDSGRISYISTYSFCKMRFISFGGSVASPASPPAYW